MPNIATDERRRKPRRSITNVLFSAVSCCDFVVSFGIDLSFSQNLRAMNALGDELPPARPHRRQTWIARSGTRWEDALQSDVEIDCQIRHEVVVRLITPGGCDRVVTHR